MEEKTLERLLALLFLGLSGTRRKNALAIRQTNLLQEAGVNIGRLSSLLAELRQRLAQLRRARFRRSARRL